MMPRLSHLARERAGSVTVELALLAPILATMLIGLIDISTAYSSKLRVEQVAQRTIEKVMQNGFVTSQETTLEAEAETAAGVGADADVTFWLECNAVVQTGASAYSNGCPEGAQYGRYVQVDIERDYTPLILHTFTSSNADGTLTVRGTAGIRIQ